MTDSGQQNVPDDPRLVEAKIEKAQAEARKAAAEAAAAERAEAEASTAEARQQREAEAKKATAEAEQAAAEARQAQVAALIPDFSKVQVPALKVEGDQAVRGNDLARHALRDAAAQVASAVAAGISQPEVGAKLRVLLTADSDLATADGAYVEVDAGLTRLVVSADKLLAERTGESDAFAVAPFLAAAAGAIPGLVSMLAPRNTLSSRAIATDDTVVVAAVAGSLVGQYEVHIDDFRLVPTDGLVARERELRERRDRLATFKLEQERTKIDQDTIRTAAAERVTQLLKMHDAPPTEGPPPNLDVNLAAARHERDAAAQSASKASVTADSIGELVGAIDAFLLACHAPAEGGRSPFVSAALHEQLRQTAAEKRYDAVVFAKGSGGSVDQRIEELFARKDRIEAIASVSVAYWVIQAPSSNVCASGVATGTARLSGKLGESLKITDVPIG
jgi:hypothetical protein